MQSGQVVISWDVESWRRVGQRVSFLSAVVPSFFCLGRGEVARVFAFGWEHLDTECARRREDI